MNCNEFDQHLAAYLYDDLPAALRQECGAHLAGCGNCRELLEKTRGLHQIINERVSPEPSPALVAHCRASLEEALDLELAGLSWKSLLAHWTSSFGGVSRLPLASALTLILLGFGLGWTLRPRASHPGTGITPPAADLSSISDSDLGDMRINDISQVAPSAKSGDVRITVNAERRMTLEGSLDSPRIRQVLIDAVTGYDDPGIRRDSMELLRPQADDPAVRNALLYSIQNDSNPGVRLDALAAAREMAWCPEVRRTLLNTVEHDKNAGVRVSAIDQLVDHPDPATLPALRRLAAVDPNPYIRMKSLAAVRKLQGE